MIETKTPFTPRFDMHGLRDFAWETMIDCHGPMYDLQACYDAGVCSEEDAEVCGLALRK